MIPKEFWEWAKKQGWPGRGPRGSDQNLKRALMLPQLIAKWNKDRDNAA